MREFAGRVASPEWIHPTPQSGTRDEKIASDEGMAGCMLAMGSAAMHTLLRFACSTAVASSSFCRHPPSLQNLEGDRGGPLAPPPCSPCPRRLPLAPSTSTLLLLLQSKSSYIVTMARGKVSYSAWRLFLLRRIAAPSGGLEGNGGNAGQSRAGRIGGCATARRHSDLAGAARSCEHQGGIACKAISGGSIVCCYTAAMAPRPLAAAAFAFGCGSIAPTAVFAGLACGLARCATPIGRHEHTQRRTAPHPPACDATQHRRHVSPPSRAQC